MLNINKLNPIDLNCSIFTVYDYTGLSMQEILCQFFSKINELIDSQNQVIDLTKWLVGQGLKEEVAKQLNQWLIDGTLATIINETIFRDLNNKINGMKDEISSFKEEVKNDFTELENNINDDVTAYKEMLKSMIDKLSYLCTSKEGIGREVNQAIAKGFKTIKIYGQTYELDEPIILKDDVEIYGDKNTIIINNNDTPIIKTSGIYNEFVSNCYLHDLHLIKNKATNHWHLDLCNLNMSKIERIRCEMGAEYPIDIVGGLYVYYNGEYVGEGGAYSLCMDKLDFRSCSVKIGITDCYLTNSNIWGKNRKYALWIASSSQQIDNCQFVGGSWGGGIYIKNESNYDVEILKITNCYFDGSYANIDTYSGIYAEKLRSSVITGNTFWRQKDCGLILVDPKACVISNNAFEDNGTKNLTLSDKNVEGGLYDIKLTGVLESNIISNNTFASYDNYHIKPKAIDVSASSKWDNNVFMNNIIFNNGHYDASPFNGFTSLGSNTLMNNGCYGSWLQEHKGSE